MENEKRNITRVTFLTIIQFYMWFKMFQTLFSLYPTINLIVVSVLIAIGVKVYFRKTVGICKCTTRLDGKTVVITGCTSGIGRETAFDLAARGARIIMGCRDLVMSKVIIDEIKAKTGNENIFVHELHLDSFRSINRFTDIIHKTESRLDILINNAGGESLGSKLTENGIDMVMQVNHFGPFLLTNLLLDLLKKSAPSRIITVSSLSHFYARLDLENINKNFLFLTDSFKYANSKLCNILMSNFLADHLKTCGVTSNSLHPGLVSTRIHRNLEIWKKFFVKIVFLFMGKNAKEGAQSTIHLAVCEDLKNVTGKYFSECQIATPSYKVNDRKLIENVWTLSEKLVKLQPDEKHY